MQHIGKVLVELKEKPNTVHLSSLCPATIPPHTHTHTHAHTHTHTHTHTYMYTQTCTHCTLVTLWSSMKNVDCDWAVHFMLAGNYYSIEDPSACHLVQQFWQWCCSMNLHIHHKPNLLESSLHHFCISPDKWITHKFQLNIARCELALKDKINYSIDHLYVMPLLPRWRTITKDSSLTSIVRSTNPLSFESPGTDCKPSIHVHVYYKMCLSKSKGPHLLQQRVNAWHVS